MTTTAEVKKMDKQALRKLATQLGVDWDKRTDGEEALKKKCLASLAAAAPALENDDTEFDVSRRAPTETTTDPKTGKTIKRPTGCFGWYFNPTPKPGIINCQKDCPHWKPCKKFTEASSAALAELEEEEKLEAEVEAVTDDDVELAVAAQKAPKKAKKASEEESMTEDEVEALTEKSKLKVNYDLEWAVGVEDADFRKFYKRIVKANPEGSVIKVSVIVDALVEVMGLTGDADDRKSIVDDILPDMISEGNFKIP